MNHLVPYIDEAITPKVRLGLICAEPVAIASGGSDLAAEIDHVCADLESKHCGKSPGEIPGLAAARELYRAFGVDPTKTRPSSEALLRRVLKKNSFPRISNAVDLCNLCALKFLLSLGLYDADKIEGGITLRCGQPDESFAGIRKDQVHLAGRLVLADQAGPFGNPTSDSKRTSVSADTRRLWMVIFAPASFPKELLQAHVETSCNNMARYLAAENEPVETNGTVIP